MFTRGTHRAVDPRDTLDRIRPHLQAMGITRVANITGLDRIGIPVVMVCRPNGRALAVSQGKGLDLDAAKASGLGESIEAFHAERILLPLRLATYTEMRDAAPALDPMTLPRTRGSVYHPDVPLLWIEGRDLMAHAPTWVPYELVHFHYLLPRPMANGCFAATTNGLASGNTLDEAISHGICEVVERDALTLWPIRPRVDRARRRVNLLTVDDAACQEVLARYEAARIEVDVHEVTTDIGLAAFQCRIAARSPDPLRPSPVFRGSGCHPAREVALLRALTEAAQNRLTVIAGSRDDMDRSEYARYLESARAQTLHHTNDAGRAYGDAPTFDGASITDDLAFALGRLQAAGVARVVAVDLTRPESPLAVARVVIPGLEGIGAVPGYVHGPRAAALAAEQGESGGV